jgi:O-antigen/teichoic acid export membrane protein
LPEPTGRAPGGSPGNGGSGHNLTPVIKRNLLYNSLLSVSQLLFPLIIYPYTFKILEPEGVGLVSFAESLTQYLISFAAVGIPFYGVIETAKARQNKERLDRLFTELVIIQLALTGIILLLFVGCILFVGKLADHRMLYFISCGTLLMSVFTVEWFFQGIEQFRYITARSVLIRTIFVVLVFLFVKSKSDLTLYYALTFITVFLNAVINFWYASKIVQLKFKVLTFKRHFRPLLTIFFSNVAISVYILLDTVILGFLSTDLAVGYYSTAIKIAKIPLAFMTALSTALIPRISASFSSGNHDYVRNLVRKSFTYIILLSVPIGAGLYLLAPDLIRLLANDKFLPAIQVIRVLAPLTLLIGLSNLFALQMLTSMGKEKLTLYAVTIGMVLSIAGNLVLIPKYSYMGTAYTTLVTETLVTVLTGWYAIRFFTVRLPFKLLWQSALACVLFYPCTRLADRYFAQPVQRIIADICLTCPLYFIILYFVFRNSFLRDTVKGLVTKLGYGKI